MQMNPLLQNLIEQYYGSLDALPQDLSQFLQTVNNLFASVSIDSGSQASSQVGSNTALSEKQLAALQKYSMLLSEINNAHEAFTYLSSMLIENFDFIAVRVFGTDPSTSAVTLVSSAVKPTHAGQIPENLGSVHAVLESKKSLFTHHDEGSYVEFSIPLIGKQKLLGILNVLGDHEKAVNQNIRATLEIIASQTSLAIVSFVSETSSSINQVDPSFSRKTGENRSWKSYKEISTFRSHQYGYDPNLRTAVHLEDSVEIPVEALPNNPLKVQGEVIGSFGINIKDGEPLTEDERALLESISEEVSQALERAQLFESSQRSAAELAVLNEMGNLFSEALDEETIIEGLYTYTSKLITVPQFYVAFYDEADETISFPKVILNGEVVTPGHPAFPNFSTRPAGTGLTGYIISNRRPILIQEDAEEILKEIGLPYQSFGQQTQSWLGVPMTMGDQVLGVITIQSDTEPGLYNQHHLELLSTIASQAAVAINNIRLFQQEQERAEQERLVRTITDKVRRGRNTETILQIAIEELSQVLNAEVSSIQLGTAEQLIERSNSISRDHSLVSGNGNQTTQNHHEVTGDPNQDEV